MLDKLRRIFFNKKHLSKKIIEKIPGYSPPRPFSFMFLNITQFLGVLNDNIFKLVMVFLLIGILGGQEASSILSLAGGIYVIPFLLFSSVAGILADRFSKHRLIVGIKIAEVFIMGAAIVAFGWKIPVLCYILLFLLGTHSALFAPSKYGIIPEITPKDRVSRANGIISSFTYLAMILGTFFASFLSDITKNNFSLISWILFGSSLIGLACSFGIQKTSPSGSKKRISVLFFKEVFITLRYCYTEKHLFTCVLACSFFLFIGAFTQLNIIPMAMQSLHLSPVAGGYLFLSTAIGISLGSLFAGKLSKKRIELGIPCVACFGIALMFWLLSLFAHFLILIIIALILLGFFGGLFIVPLETYNQIISDPTRRGQVIATANFLSFTGVLIASLALYFFNQSLHFSPATSFAIVGGITFIVFAILSLRLSDFSLPIMAKIIYRWRYYIDQLIDAPLPKGKGMVLILRDATWKKGALLMSTLPQASMIIINEKGERHPFKNLFFNSVKWLTNSPSLLEDTGNYVDREQTCIIYLKKTIDTSQWKVSKSFWNFINKADYEIKVVDVELDTKKKYAQITYSKELEQL